MAGAKQLKRAKTAEEVGVSSRECRAFIDDARNSNLEFHSMMIIRHGKVAAEWYNEPYNKDTPHMMYSASKSVTSTAIGFAVDEGLLSLDDKVLSFFPDYLPKKPDSRFDKLTVRTLLTMTSGKNPNILTDKGKVDWIADYINCQWLFTPGTDFLYVSENIYMLCAIITRVAKMSVVDYLMPRLFEPLGIDRPFWETDPTGIEAGGWGLYLKTEDLAKFMLCYLDDGKYAGKQVIPEFWAKQAVSFQVKPNQHSLFPDNRVGYGYCFWHTDTKPMCYRADGLFGQYGFNFPELDAIFVSTGGVADEGIARECVWRHFPKAFLEEQEPVKIENSMADLPTVSMHPYIQSVADGKLIKVLKHPELVLTGFEPSVLPIAVTYMMTEKGKTVDDIIIKFSSDECTFSWTEGKYRNTIPCGMDGKLRFGEMHLAGLHFKTAAYAVWKSDKTLEISIRPYETVGKRVLTLTFERNGTVLIKPASVPSMKDVSSYLGKAAAEVIPYDAINNAAGYIMKAVPALSEPVHIGKIL